MKDILSSSLPPPPIALSRLFHSSCNPPEDMFTDFIFLLPVEVLVCCVL